MDKTEVCGNGNAQYSPRRPEGGTPLSEGGERCARSCCRMLAHPCAFL